MVTITLYARQQMRHRCIEQSFGLCGRGWGWDDLGEWHWNMYIIICEMGRQVQVRRVRQGAQGWCTGMTQRNGMGREVGVGFRMGSTCTPMADSSQCMAKPLKYCKVISLQLKWIKLKKKKEEQKAFWDSSFIEVTKSIVSQSRIQLSNWADTKKLINRNLS